jgi:tRNA (guanine26-N2/guanine27-N2)-dimethyltransferase
MASEAASEYKPLSAPPADGQLIEHKGKQYVTIKEGLAYILVPRPALDAAKQTNLGDKEAVQQVFYNPIQQFNRDLTVLTIKAYGRERLEEKAAAYKSKVRHFNDKKRKRQDPKTDDKERPAKAQKVSEGAEPGLKVEGEAQQPAKAGQESAVEAVPVVDVEPSDAGKQAPLAENGNAESAVMRQEKPKANPPFKILDALSATGLRALRYAAEIPFVTSVTSNDLLADAVESIKVNVEHNKPRATIDVSHDDAIAHMYTLVAQELRKTSMKNHRHPVKSDKYDVVDLDPYGSATPFLDAAVQAVRDDGGLLCVTCTDSGVWASNGYPEKAYSLYGGIPLKGGQHSHEVGLRLILHSIQTAAAKYGLAMEPLLSLSIDFYIRVFVRIRKSPASVKFQAGKSMIAYNCDNGCGAWQTQLLARNKATPNKKGSGTFYKHIIAGGSLDKNCEHCGSLQHITGPMYAGRLHSPTFIQRVLAEVEDAPKDVYGTTTRITGMLNTALEEYLPLEEEMELREAIQKFKAETDEKKDANETEKKDIEKRRANAVEALKLFDQAAIEPYPFYFLPAYIAGRMHCITPPENAVRGALVGLGYRVTRSHCKPGSIKTDAPWKVIWHIMREWVRQKEPVKEDNIKPSSPAYRLLRLGQEKKEVTNDGEAKEASAGDDVMQIDDSVVKEGEENKAEAVDEVDKLEVVFDLQLGKDQDKRKFVRYQQNPRENWGPMGRATGK